MRTALHIARPLTLGVGLAAALFLAAGARANVIHVPGDYPTIQAAIVAAQNGDEIIVAPGTYTETINLSGKAVHLRSAEGPEVTIIDATGLETAAAVVTINSGEEHDTIIDGLTITGGTGPVVLRGIRIDGSHPTIVGCIITRNGYGQPSGAGLFLSNSNAIVKDSVISHNMTEFSGGGMRNSSSNPQIINTLFKENIALRFSYGHIWGDGGGMYNFNSNPVIVDCVFDENESAAGGAIRNLNSTVLVTGTHFINNSGHMDEGDGSGAIFHHGTGDLVVTNCTFTGNTGIYNNGGAIHTWGNLMVVGSHFEGNSVLGHGGAIAGGKGGVISVSDSVFTDNSATHLGGAIYSSGSVEVSDSTFYANASKTGGGMYLFGSENMNKIKDCMFSSNVAIEGGGLAVVVGDVIVESTEFRDNVASAQGGAVWVSPTGMPFISDSLFCGNDPDHVFGQWEDRGGNQFFEECPDDCAPADLNCDGSVGVADLLILLAAWGPCEDCPDSPCRADLDGNCNVGVEDLLILLQNWG